jgi:hypothetical protein
MFRFSTTKLAFIHQHDESLHDSLVYPMLRWKNCTYTIIDMLYCWRWLWSSIQYLCLVFAVSPLLCRLALTWSTLSLSLHGSINWKHWNSFHFVRNTFHHNEWGFIWCLITTTSKSCKGFYFKYSLQNWSFAAAVLIWQIFHAWLPFSWKSVWSFRFRCRFWRSQFFWRAVLRTLSFVSILP